MDTPELLRVTNIRVEKLFGRYDHDIPLHTEERVTIIHGPNGVGKTILLKLVTAALSGKIVELLKVPFKQFELKFNDGAILTFKKESSQLNLFDVKERSFRAYINKPGAFENSHDFANDTHSDGIIDRMSREMALRSQLRSAEVKSKDAGVMGYLYAALLKDGKENDFSLPEWLEDIRNKVHVHFIEAQRLIHIDTMAEESDRRGHGPQLIAMVESQSRDLQTKISTALQEYAKQSQSLDQTFPQRLLDRNERILSTREIKQRMRSLVSNRLNLTLIGLIGDNPSTQLEWSALEKIDENNQKVMTLYVEDTEKKLGVLDDIARRLEVLLGIINKKLTNKSVRFDRAKGFIVTTDDGHAIELDDLSSGEQHELVLLYDLLFRVSPNTLVLIDEPELSLHLTWQKDFLSDLLQIIETTKIDVVLATHSIFIGGERNDLMVPMSINGDVSNLDQAS